MGAARRIALLAALGSLATFASGGSPAGACACGIAIEATVSEERALVIEGDGSEEIILSLDLASDGSEAPAVVLPVPGEPEVAAIESGDPLAYLDEVTAAQEAVGGAPGDGSDGAGAPVDVIGRDEIGGYDVSRLAATEPGALERWLADNGYELPPGAEPILAEYVDEGWSYVAIRLAESGDGRLRPLRVSFPAETPVYPMRLAQLGTVPIGLTLYVLADGEREVSGLTSGWDGPVADLAPPPPPELEEIFSHGSYLTKLEASAADPAGFTTDLAIGPVAGAAAPAEEAAGGGGEDDGPSTLTVIVVALGAAGLVATSWIAARGRGGAES